MARRRRSTIFSLPPQAFQCIATELDLSDIFTLSLCSRRSFEFVKNTTFLLESAKLEVASSLTLHMHMSAPFVELSFNRNGIIHWYFIGERIRHWNPLEEKPKISVEMNSGQSNQKTLVFAENGGGFLSFYGIVSSSVQDFLRLAEHISTLFNATLGTIEIAPGLTEHLEAILSVPIVKNCSEIWIGGKHRGTISHEAMRQILERFHGKKVKFNCYFDRNFNLSPKYHCESLLLNTTQVTNQHLNVFLHQWVRSKCKKPVDLEIRARRIFKEQEKWGVYDDICWMKSAYREFQKEKWDLEKIAEGLTRYVITYLKKKRVLVFQRETDGMQVKLQTFKNQDESKLLMCDNRKDN